MKTAAKASKKNGGRYGVFVEGQIIVVINSAA